MVFNKELDEKNETKHVIGMELGDSGGSACSDQHYPHLLFYIKRRQGRRGEGRGGRGGGRQGKARQS
jgi:hypothetical protein